MTVKSEPISVQIAGADPHALAQAARYNVEHGAQIIDINMGCPAKKVCNAFAGSALLANERSSIEFCEASSARSTYRSRSRSAPAGIAASAMRCASRASRKTSGIQALAVHGRTRACGFGGDAEYDTIAAVKVGGLDSGDRQW